MRLVQTLAKFLLFALLAEILGNAEEPVMRLFTTEDGLVRNSVTKIRRDSRGRLWFCTVEGLSLFDGQRFANYTTAQGLPHRIVNDILEAGDGSYWLATGAGLYHFRPRSAKPASFERVPLIGASEVGEPEVLLRSRSGEVWCGGEKGLCLIHRDGRQEGITLPSNGHAYPGDPLPGVMALLEGPDGALWIGTETGLMRRRNNGDVSYWKGPRGLPAPIKALLFDHEGLLWAGGDGGFLTLDIRREPPAVQRYPFVAPHPLGGIGSIYMDRRGGIWIGALGLVRMQSDKRGGILSSRRYRFQYSDRASMLGSQYSTALTDDSLGNLWLALRDLGVVRILQPGLSGLFTETDGLESRNIVAILESNDQRLLVVTGHHHTLNEFDGNRFTPINPRLPSTITGYGWGENTVTLQDHNGEWWIATGNGLLRYPRVVRPADLEHTMPRVYSTADGLEDDVVTRLFEDSGGNIWLGTATGVSRWGATTQTIENLTPRLRPLLDYPTMPHSFSEDAAGNIWIGFYQGGLVRLHNGHADSIREGLPAGSINALLRDHQGRLWVASGLQGLACIPDPTALSPQFRLYGDAQGLHDKHLFALAQDKGGRIYIAGGHGADRLDPASGAVYHFDIGGFLPPGEPHYIHCDRQGAIWFGSNYGLARHVPEADSIAVPGSPVIHEIRVAGVSRLVSDEGEARVDGLQFPAGNHSVEITYGSVDFSGRNLHYRYRLTPGDANWQPTSARSVQYGGIDSGTHRFDVQAIDPSGLASAGIASVEFRVAAPFWQTWWFLGSVAGSIAALLFAAHLLRVRQLLALERVRAHLAADLHDELGAGLTEIAILTEVVKQQTRTRNLEIVAERARELRGVLSDIVWSVNPECDTMEELIRRWRQTAFALFGNDRLEFTAPSGSETAGIELTPERRRQLLLFFKEVITNAARHATAELVRVEVRLTQGWLHVEVSDDGCGLAPEQVEGGNGLKNMAARAKLLNGMLKIESHPGEGTTVRLSAPLTKG